MKHNLIPRARYLDMLISLKDKPVIKTISGVRRCGKSTLLLMYRDYLVSSGIDENNIILLNLTHLPDSKTSSEDLITTISGVSGRAYILLDEVQMIESWDRLVLTLFETFDCDIYVTGSNSVMFASNLSSMLSGRAVTIEMFPFSYSEYLDFTGLEDSNDAVTEYMAYGGFPLALMTRESKTTEVAILEDIYGTIVLKDIVQRYHIRNQAMLDRISRFLMHNIGNLVSVKSIRDYMSSNGQKVNFETVDSYLGYLAESLAFYRVGRFNLGSKEELSTNDKFYLCDLGLRTAALGRRDADIDHLMENVVFLELRRRGYHVNIGKIGVLEVDFIARDSETALYVQVCYSVKDPDTLDRELAPLRKIKDDYRKIIIVMERSACPDHDGILEIGLRDFLLSRSYVQMFRGLLDGCSMQNDVRYC